MEGKLKVIDSKHKVDITQVQHEQQIWSNKNGLSQKGYQMILGLIEELGELSHAHLKHEQNIRKMGDRKASEAAKKDAVGDIFIFLLGYCNTQGFNLEAIIKDTWEQVSKRNWKEKPNEDY